jgi:hypothetical protein
MSESQFFVLMSVAFTAPSLPTWAAIALGGICLLIAGHGARRAGK